ncbi:MAG: hypothetical protein ACRET5_06715, partial [Steroidobacteraceae bacterium]
RTQPAPSRNNRRSVTFSIGELAGMTRRSMHKHRDARVPAPRELSDVPFPRFRPKLLHHLESPCDVLRR